MKRALGWVLVASVLWVPGVQAQEPPVGEPQAPEPLSGVVRDIEGGALDQAVVEAWGDDIRLRAVTTDAQGRFTLSGAVAARTTSLYAHRLGYRATRISVVPGTGFYVIQLALAPLAMEGLVVDVERERCTKNDDRRARALWEATRALYDDAIDSLGTATYLASAIQSVPLAEIGAVPVSDQALEQRGSAPLLRNSWRRRVQRTGYARKLSAPSPDGMFDEWGYPPLDADFATHFIDEVFGRLHRLSVVEEDDEGWLLRFCPKDDDRPSIEGFLQIAPDSSLLLAEWSFNTDEPDEGAGGRAVFARGESGSGYLLPSEGLFWRRIAGGRLLQRYQKYQGWLTAPGDSVPFLPVRSR